jgi:hypothetical protein
MPARALFQQGKNMNPYSAIWHAPAGDIPVTVILDMGADSAGRHYLKIEGSDTGVPADELDKKPDALTPIFENIPEELKERPQWVIWRYEWKADKEKWDKPPCNARTGYHTDVTNPANWATYDEAVAAYRKGKWDGIGYAFTKDDPYTGFDLDDCIVDSELSAEADDWIMRFDTYTETSPSATGVKGICRAKALHNGKNPQSHVEIYDRDRYFTVTGHVLGEHDQIHARQGVANEFVSHYFPGKIQPEPKPPKEKRKQRPPVDGTADVEIDRRLRTAFGAANGDKIERLFNGDISDYGNDHSAADLGLCGHFAFYSSGSAEVLDTMFRRSKLLRDKWNERHSSDGRTYGEMTVDKALESQGEFYHFNGHPDGDNGNLNSLLSQPDIEPVVEWPKKLSDIAYHGVAGEYVRAIAPHTESDQAAILIQFLFAFSNLIGRGAYFLAESTRHYLNEFVVLVGRTAKGRKGTSLNQVLARFEGVDKDDYWLKNCQARGMSTGEGLIWRVRDAIHKTEPVKEKGRVVNYDEVMVDPGVVDKRLLVLEEEFAKVLRMAGREGNSLSAVIRLCWDSGNLDTMTKNSPAKATGAHISIIGHITIDELLRNLDSTEAANGFANRYLYFCVKRAQILPEGGDLASVDFSKLQARLRDAVKQAKDTALMTLDDDARDLWWEVYTELSEGKPGLVGSITARAEPHVRRIACIYALLDGLSVVERVHLEAALEIWRYAEDSARYIFGESLGDPVADQVLQALKDAGEDGLSRTEISTTLNRHANKTAIARALRSLSETSRIYSVKEETAGRSAELWFIQKATAKKAKEAKKGCQPDMEDI